MAIGPRTGIPRRLATLFVTLAVVPLVLLGWLGMRLLDNEATLERQRLQARLDDAAELIASEIEKTLARWEVAATEGLAGPVRDLPAGTTLLVFDNVGLIRVEGVRLPFHPASTPPADSKAAGLLAAEAAEHRERDPVKAERIYRLLAESAQGTSRAQALIGLARCLRSQGRLRDALAVYEQLASLDEAPVFGFPAALLAHEQQRMVFEALRDRPASDRERAWLSSAVLDGRYRLDRAAFDYFVETLELDPPTSAALAVADVVADEWRSWRQQVRGRMALSRNRHGVAAAWQTGSNLTAVVASSVESLTGALSPTLEALRVNATMEDPMLGHVWSSGLGTNAADRAAKRSLKETGLPWTLRVAPADVPGPAGWLSRRRLFAAGFALLALVIGGASYAVFRSVNRELRVARLQSDFVSAVSHEFRTPLTAISHLSEVLEDGSASGEEAPRYFRTIGKETRRLQKLVESLLDFGRLESGRREYAMRDLDAVSFTTAVVEEFRGEIEANAHRVELCVSPEPLPIAGDPDALTVALRNLLENAVKYSPDAPAVTVSVERAGDRVAIAVEDRGVGIPATEQREVFDRFVRGSAARELNVRGTGVGLAMTKRIVDAHGGRLEVVSEVGRGSRFTVVLPLGPLPSVLCPDESAST